MKRKPLRKRKLIRPVMRIVEKIASDRGYRIRWEPTVFMLNSKSELTFDLEFVIAHLMIFRASIFFIQIGANDGVSNDPLHKFITHFDWEGILLEPLPEVFRHLTATYRDKPKLQLINAAISEQDGWRTMYTVRMDGVGFDKAQQFSTFQKESILSQTGWIPDIAQRIEERQVRCVSFDTLLQRTNGRDVDILQIDAEGYDFAILKMIDFSRLRPAIICYEHSHGAKAQQEEAVRLLFNQGYRLTRGNSDTIAYRPIQTFGFYWPQTG